MGKTKRTKTSKTKSLQTQELTSRPRRQYKKWRIVSLVLVHLLFIAHFIHWRITGKTLAPLEFSEVMQTVNAGILTAGFLFMLAALLSVFLFGRFFCSWACHMVAIQDLSAWVLKKIGIKPKPIRSRLLLFVPAGVMFYMFVLPILRRVVLSYIPQSASILGEMPAFEVRVTSNTEGFASFITDDFWRNLPDPLMAVVTLLICGFLTIYFLGTRSFCRYVCPYGAVFGIADRFAVGQVLLTGTCIQCAKCTAACTSQIRVHEEVIRYDRVIDSGCFKCLDCVTVCPEEALSFGFEKPQMFSPLNIVEVKPRQAKTYDFTLGEEIGLLAIFSISLALFTGLPDWLASWSSPLYGQISLFLGLSLAVLTAVIAIQLLWLVRRPTVRFQGYPLKTQGQLQRSGKVFVTLAVLWLFFLGDSAVVQYHMAHTARAVELTKKAGPNALRLQPVDPAMVEIADQGQQHLEHASLWGLFSDQRIARRRAWFALVQGDMPTTISSLQEAIANDPDDPDSYYQLARVLAVQGSFVEATKLYYQTEQRSRQSHRFSDAVIFGSQQLTALGLPLAAIGVLEEAIRTHPTDVRPLLMLSEFKKAEGNTVEAERLIQRAHAVEGYSSYLK